MLSTMLISVEDFVLILKQNLSHNSFPCGFDNMHFVFVKLRDSFFSFMHLITFFCTVSISQFSLEMLSHGKVTQVSSAKSLVIKLVAEERLLT